MLEKVAQAAPSDADRIQYLTGLGQIAGDRLKDDERAVNATSSSWSHPDDRRAQEQLKKRYVALGRWDDLALYHENGNWDEFIRLLESNESKAETPEQRVSMLHKVVEPGSPEQQARPGSARP